MLLFVLLVALAAPPTEPCAYDKAAMLALSPAVFDETLKMGWRPVADRPGCLPAAADLIAVYRKTRWADLRESQAHSLYWHEGQLRAASGQTERAVLLMMAGVDTDAKDDREDYALGTIAYLQHDLVALKAARDRMIARPEPAWYREMRARTNAEYGEQRVPPWPMNLDELNGLIACFDKPYEEAYAYSCRPPRAEAAGR